MVIMDLAFGTTRKGEPVKVGGFVVRSGSNGESDEAGVFCESWTSSRADIGQCR
jgi:hypothetical protein